MLPPSLWWMGTAESGAELPVGLAGWGRPQYLGHLLYPLRSLLPRQAKPNPAQQGIAPSCDGALAALFLPIASCQAGHMLTFLGLAREAVCSQGRCLPLGPAARAGTAATYRAVECQGRQ
jgi:hypothetical protein